MSFIPAFMRLRRVLGEGYHVDDLSAALREHQLVRAEEIEYERRLGSRWVRSVLRVVLGISAGVLALGGFVEWQMLYARGGGEHWYLKMHGVEVWLLLAAVGVTVSGVPLAGEFIRHRLASRVASASISLWKGKWGARFAKLAGIGLKKAERPMLGMPVLTEIALGRATDHLYLALPKEARRELSALPETVRRLEGDASRLRESINSLDDQLAAFERGADSLRDDVRRELEAQVRDARARSVERLAATVAALESIRLDLLRLQLGRAPITSVTATLEAAREIGDRIGDSIAAQLEVEHLLLASRTASLSPAVRPHAEASEAHTDGDDADTPVDGVPVAHG